MARRLRVLGLCVALTTSGCAVMSARPPSNSLAAGEVPNCNPGKGGVAVDVVMTVLLGVGFLAAAAGGEGEAAAFFGVTGAAYGGSAAYGSSSANKCQRAIAAAEQVRQDRMAGIDDRGVVPAAVAKPKPEPAAVAKPKPDPETAAETAADAESEAEADSEPEPDSDDSDRWRDFWVEVSR